MESSNEARDGMVRDASGQRVARARHSDDRALLGVKRPWLSRVVADLVGRSDQNLVEIVAAQISTAAEGAQLARAMALGDVAPADARSQMGALEHRGDQQRAALVGMLSASLTTPIDREDLFRLSRLVDDVLDELRDFVRESDLYSLRNQASAAAILDALLDGLQALQSAVRQMVQRNPRAGVTTLAAKKASNRIRQLYQLELAELFRRQLDIELMKRRELLRRIDVVGIHLGEAADALADGIMKRSR